MMVRPNLVLFNHLMSEIHLICIQEGQLKTERRRGKHRTYISLYNIYIYIYMYITYNMLG